VVYLKICKVVRFVRSSPQWKWAWLSEVIRGHGDTARDTCNMAKEPLMLILDVKTRWSSTHQMLRE
jgi:hypothetical protein